MNNTIIMLGLDLPRNGLAQTAILAFIMYLIALLALRFGDKRFLGKNAAFDIVLGIVIGSVVSRAINGSASLLPTIAAIVILVALHWFFAIISLQSEKISRIVKGKSMLLVKDGFMLSDQMRKSHVSKDDLITQLRLHGKINNIENVKEAYLEKGGKISIIPKKKEPKIVDIKIEEGIKTVRILIE